MAMQAGAEAELEILGACCDGDGDGDGDDRHQISLMVELFDELNGKDDALRRHTRRLVRRHRTTIEIVANALLRRECLPANRIDELVWPSTMTRQHFVSFRQLRLRFGITVTRENVTLAMRVGSFPRGYLFNGRTLWRVGDVQNFVKDLH